MLVGIAPKLHLANCNPINSAMPMTRTGCLRRNLFMFV